MFGLYILGIFQLNLDMLAIWDQIKNQCSQQTLKKTDA